MRQEEWIKPIVFRRRLAISGATYREARASGRVKEEKRDGIRKIEWFSNRKSFIDTCKSPMRYTSQAVMERQRARDKRKAKQRAEARGELPPGMPEDLTEKDFEVELDEPEKAGVDDLLEADVPEDEEGEFSERMTKREAEAVKQQYLARQAKVKFLKEVGSLMETTQILREWQEIAVTIRKQMLAIPDRVAELFASMTDAREIHNNLTEEITHALNALRFEIKDQMIEQKTESGEGEDES